MKKKFLCGAAVMAMTASMLFGCAGDSAEEKGNFRRGRS